MPLNPEPPPGAAEVAVSVTCERDSALAVRPDAERDARTQQDCHSPHPTALRVTYKPAFALRPSAALVALALHSSCAKPRVPLTGNAGAGAVVCLVGTLKRTVTCSLH